MIILHAYNKKIGKVLFEDVGVRLPFRPYLYCETMQTERGLILCNYLTSEAVLLEETDFSGSGRELSADNLTRDTLSYLFRHRFLVQEDHEDFKDVDQLRELARAVRRLKFHGYQRYTVLPTTDCNARCYYCYEKGCGKITMDRQTAMDTAGYILKTCAYDHRGEFVISWFGGEPLCNIPAIDIISEELEKAGKNFRAHMITNGLLFDRDVIEKAVKNWRLTKVQITLDGTEEVYNKTKAYTGFKGNAFERVLANIECLLEAGIKVQIRLNVSRSNIDDMHELVSLLNARFTALRPTVYTKLLFQYENGAGTESYAELDGRRLELDRAIEAARLDYRGRRTNSLKIFGCMADSPDGVVILPDGKLHSCEHFGENHTWGSIYGGETKKSLCHPAADGGGMVTPLAYWEDYLFTEQCRTCRAYPFCVISVRCPFKHCDRSLLEKNIPDYVQNILSEREMRDEQTNG